MRSNIITFSDAALAVKAKFYNKRAMIYVEGPDDVVFWSEIFDDQLYEIQEVNGCENLEPYINKIYNGNTSFIVACDSDYLSFSGEFQEYPLIVQSYGYSIENNMYCVHNIDNAIKKLSRSRQDNIPFINTWYDKFCTDCKRLLIYDIASVIFSKGISCCGGSCVKYTKGNSSFEIDSLKVEEFINSICDKFTKEEIDYVELKLNEEQRDLRHIIKGHFLTSAVSNLIKKKACEISNKTTITLSNDALYSLMVKCDKECNPLCVDKQTLKQRVSIAEGCLTI